MRDKHYYVYIMTNQSNTVLYTGMTNDLQRRVYEHREKLLGGFTKRYDVTKLVYYELFDSPEDAIRREKQIKGGSRRKKVDLISSANESWADLYEQLWDCFADARNDKFRVALQLRVLDESQ